MRGPLADSGEALEARDRIRKITTWIEQAGVGRSGRSNVHEGLDARRRHSQARQGGGTEALRARKDPIQLRMAGEIRNVCTESRHDLTGEPRGALERDLLSEHCADRDFEPVPRPGYAQSGPRADQRREYRIRAQRRGDGGWIGAEIEQTARAHDDRRQCIELREAHDHAQSRLFGCV